jgi:hypothetical protein
MTLSLPTNMLPPDVAQTFAALLLAHVLADFWFQFNWMIARKRQFAVFLLHIAIVFFLSALALGWVWQVALMVALAHLVIDLIKTYLLPQHWRETLTAFLVDQGAHIVTMLAAAILWPAAMGLGWWADWAAQALPVMILASGYITAVWAGGYAVGLLTQRFDMPDTGLPDAGRLIGQLERTMIFLLFLIGEPAGIGFLIAAKSVLRLDAVRDDRKTSEYVIIGTLASFAWALAIAFVTQALLEIVKVTP